MNRRDFLRRTSAVAAGVVAADQIDLLDRLGWKRRFFPGATFAPKGGGHMIPDGGYESLISTPAPTKWVTIELGGKTFYQPVWL